tara:strand:+ start:432 stop:593 length:162 start_codon:yes stop_codon:yes gene_type:complete
MKIMLLITFLFMVSCISMKNNNSYFIFDENLSKNEYKKRLIEYGKVSKFPHIN